MNPTSVTAPRTGFGTKVGATADQRMEALRDHVGNRSVGGRFVSWVKNKDGITPKEQNYQKIFQQALADKLGSKEAVNVLYKELQLSPDKPLSSRKMQMAMDKAHEMVGHQAQYKQARDNQISKGNVPDKALSPSGSALRSSITSKFNGTPKENEAAARAVIRALGLKDNEEVTDAHIATANKLVQRYEECRGTALHTTMGPLQFPNYFQAAFTNIVANGWDPRADLLSMDELVALNAYTQIDYASINKQLRDGDPSPLTQIITNLCIQGLNKLPPYDGPVSRGTDLPWDKDQNCVRGGTMTDKAFTSTSATKSFDGSHQFSIHSPGGRDVSFLSKYPEEVEVLYPPNHTFQIVSRHGTVDYGGSTDPAGRTVNPGVTQATIILK